MRCATRSTPSTISSPSTASASARKLPLVRQEVKSLNEMKGLKMRFFGLGAKVMPKLGVSTQLLAAADIFPALERGVIDATEFSMPAMDIKLGFHRIAIQTIPAGTSRSRAARS